MTDSKLDSEQAGKTTLTVRELQSELTKLNPDDEVWVTIAGAFAPLGGLTSVPQASYTVLRGAGGVPQTGRFTVAEEGIIGHLSNLGLSNEAIAEVLDRPVESIKRKRKALGF